jgi:hypothetical protein
MAIAAPVAPVALRCDLSSLDQNAYLHVAGAGRQSAQVAIAGVGGSSTGTGTMLIAAAGTSLAGPKDVEEVVAMAASSSSQLQLRYEAAMP